jgi:hypothetical protein
MVDLDLGARRLVAAWVGLACSHRSWIAMPSSAFERPRGAAMMPTATGTGKASGVQADRPTAAA